ncbi:MAG: hypothetical protein LQ345_005902 [Seirophora villosa]|nr:MAG: hypothetical protein LQ345_005902 [Seirophora villosa]
MDDSSLEKGSPESSGARQHNQDTDAVQSSTEDTGCASSHEREDDDHLLTIPRSTILRFVQALVSLAKDTNPRLYVQDDGEQSEKAAVTGSKEPRSHSTTDSDKPNASELLKADAGNTSTFRKICKLSPASRHGHQEYQPDTRCCGSWSTCSHGPRDAVKVYPPQSIKVGNEGRQFVRSKWRIDSSVEHLLDPWKLLWRPEKNAATGLSGWLCEDVQREDLQLTLVDALAAHSPFPFVERIMRKDFRNIACWISVIGIRLNDVYRSIQFNKVLDYDQSSHEAPETISPMTQIEVLIECLWACNSCANVEVGVVLESCYKRKILKQPKAEDSKNFTHALSVHICAIRIAIYLISLLFKHEVPQYKPHEDVDTIWTMPLHEVEKHMRQSFKTSINRTETDYFFRIDDLTLKDLQKLGHLCVRWTSYWDEHLRLEIRTNSRTLYLYWFNYDLSLYFVTSGLCGGLTGSERIERVEELGRTMAFLLPQETESGEHRESYESLGAPEWLDLLAGYEIPAWNCQPEKQRLLYSPRPLSDFHLHHHHGSTKFCTETRFHLSMRQQGGKKGFLNKLSYSDFPHYEHRLRELRAYMDSQKPKGLKGLWQDRRDSYAFFTLWLAIVFGILTIILAVGSLAVAIAQTWAQFRSLST